MSLTTDPRCSICGNYYPNSTGLCQRCDNVRKTAEAHKPYSATETSGWPDSKEIVILLNNILYELKELNKKIKEQPQAVVSVLTD